MVRRLSVFVGMALREQRLTVKETAGSRWAFTISPTALVSMVARRDLSHLARFGSGIGLVHSLHSDCHAGIAPETVGLRREHYGVNEPSPRMSTGAALFEILKATAVDPILLALVACSLLLGLCSPREWSQACGVVLMVALIMLVRTGLEFCKASAMETVDAVCASWQVYVVRGGREMLIDVRDIVVGDLVQLQAGEVIPADGILMSTHPLTCDESLLPGALQPKKVWVGRCTGAAVWQALMSAWVGTDVNLRA